jgi:thioredoxin reductase
MLEETDESYDVVVVGGGAAGLNGAIMLARARRSVLVVDSGAPRNAPAGGVHGMLGHDGIPPAELLERGRTEVRRYGGQVTPGQVVTVSGAEGAFTVALADGRRVAARRLLVTSGLVDELPDVAGLRERWGHDVVHCPYCHGWEVRDRPITVLGSGPMSVHQALLFRQLSDEVTYVTHTQPPTPEQLGRLVARGIRIEEGKVTQLQIVDERLAGLELADGGAVACRAVAVATRMVARAGFLADLGLRPVEHPSGMGEHIPADPTGRTDVPGVWVAGNVTDLGAQVGGSAAAGATAGARINADLVEEDIRLALQPASASTLTP